MRSQLRICSATLAVGLAALATPSAPTAEPSARPLPAATAEKLPRWRGFNLLEKFLLGGGRKPFVEQDFQMISRWGFNFVRLPMDYRFWIKNGNWEEFDEATLKEIDQAVEWGRQYGVHVCLNFHRAPGYTVASPPERTSLWTDPETQRVCALHWATFARRYKGVPNERLSFDLVNEPGGVEEEVYAPVARLLVEAIHKEDPNRLVMSDGLQWGTKPIPSLASLHIAQATRGYSPMEISHYQASWVNSQNFPVPAWPRFLGPNGILLAPTKPEGSYPLVIEGPFATDTQLRLHIMTVSTSARLVVEADGKPCWDKEFKAGAGQGEWKRSSYQAQWKTYQCTYDRDYTNTIPAGTKQVRVRVTAGDWLEVNALGLQPAAASREDALDLQQQYGRKSEPMRYAPGAPGGPFLGVQTHDRAWLWKENIETWKNLEAQGVGVMVGEWGAHNRTPHAVFLRWAEDCLANWKQAGWGWSLWNWRGSFGVLDSGRDDVAYENVEGHKLDRKLLELLQKY